MRCSIFGSKASSATQGFESVIRSVQWALGATSRGGHLASTSLGIYLCARTLGPLKYHHSDKQAPRIICVGLGATRETLLTIVTNQLDVVSSPAAVISHE